MQQKYRSYTIKVIQDTDPINPREEWENLGIMLCSHKNYILGDEQIKISDFNSWEDVENHLIKEGAIGLQRMYMLDHSGITINTTGFDYPWDSGQIGFIYTTREKIQKSFTNWKYLTRNRIEFIEDLLLDEVKVYNDYLTGNVWGYEIEKAGESLDSCWGYFGDTGCMIKEAKSIIDHIIETEIREKYPLSFIFPEMKEHILTQYT